MNIIIIDAGGGGGGGDSSTTWSPTDQTAGWTLTSSDLVATETTSSNANIRATDGADDSELFYWEFLVITVSGESMALGVRIDTDSISNQLNVGVTGNMRSNGSFFAQSGVGSTGTAVSYVDGDVLGFAINRSTQRVYIHKNGTYLNSGDPVGGTGHCFTLPSGNKFLPYFWADNNTTNNSVRIRTSSADFGYSMPSGYSVLP